LMELLLGIIVGDPECWPRCDCPVSAMEAVAHQCQLQGLMSGRLGTGMHCYQAKYHGFLLGLQAVALGKQQPGPAAHQQVLARP